MEYIKSFVKNQYTIDPSNCKCGSDEVQYEITQVIREQGASERCLSRMVISERLKKAYCPQCGVMFIIQIKEQ